jgi:hypothetical protein
MNMKISAHIKYTLHIGLQSLFRTFSYVQYFKQQKGAMNSHYLFLVICKNKFVFTINDKSENNTKSLKIAF